MGISILGMVMLALVSVADVVILHTGGVWEAADVVEAVVEDGAEVTCGDIVAEEPPEVAAGRGIGDKVQFPGPGAQPRSLCPATGLLHTLHLYTITPDFLMNILHYWLGMNIVQIWHKSN